MNQSDMQYSKVRSAVQQLNATVAAVQAEFDFDYYIDYD
jgi:hypothetical protein